MFSNKRVDNSTGIYSGKRNKEFDKGNHDKSTQTGAEIYLIGYRKVKTNRVSQSVYDND